jgi:hypothetical protein
MIEKSLEENVNPRPLRKITGFLLPEDIRPPYICLPKSPIKIGWDCKDSPSKYAENH